MGQVGDRVGGAARLQEAQAHEKAPEAGRRGPRKLLGHGEEPIRGRRAIARRRVVQGRLGGVARVSLEAPRGRSPGAGRSEEEEKAEARDQDVREPYMGPRTLGSPPARIRTSSSWK